jgi:hypothetical protein
MRQDIITFIDLIPQRLVDPFTEKVSWFVDETDERGVLYESHEFTTEKKALKFIDLWANGDVEGAINYHKSL